MATPRRLANPPIKEALVDVKVVQPTVPNVESFRRLRDELRDRYQTAEEKNTLAATLNVDKAGSVTAAAQQIGFLGIFLKSSTGDRAAQIRRDGLTVNQLGHYTSAENLFAEFFEVWPRYLHHLQPQAISRVGLRYINELRLPFQVGDQLARFLRGAPQTPPEAPQSVMAFQSNQLLRDGNAVVSVTQSLAPGRPETRYLLDIHAFVDGRMPPDAEIASLLDQLRTLKNRVFFSMLTEEALTRYDQTNV